MQILSGAWYKVVIKIIKSWWNTRKLLFHHRDQVLGDLCDLIFCKKVGDLHIVNLQRSNQDMASKTLNSCLSMWSPHLSRRKNIVKVLKECFIFNIIICKDEGDAFSISSSCFIQQFQVIHEITYVVCSDEKTNKAILETSLYYVLYILLQIILKQWLIQMYYFETWI